MISYLEKTLEVQTLEWPISDPTSYPTPLSSLTAWDVLSVTCSQNFVMPELLLVVLETPSGFQLVWSVEFTEHLIDIKARGAGLLCSSITLSK
ncbi:hypothetical protein AMECASPLE_023714, partial [Ameca splendens]